MTDRYVWGWVLWIIPWLSLVAPPWASHLLCWLKCPHFYYMDHHYISYRGSCTPQDDLVILEHLIYWEHFTLSSTLVDDQTHANKCTTLHILNVSILGYKRIHVKHVLDPFRLSSLLPCSQRQCVDPPEWLRRHPPGVPPVRLSQSHLGPHIFAERHDWPMTSTQSSIQHLVQRNAATWQQSHNAPKSSACPYITLMKQKCSCDSHKNLLRTALLTGFV